jgi:hypothetical protein
VGVLERGRHAVDAALWDAKMRRTTLFLLCIVILRMAGSAAASDRGFVPLFNGRDLDGWTLVNRSGPGYQVRDGMLVCPAGEHGNLFTTKEYSDFIFRCQYRMDRVANNGIGIRAPLQGDAAYAGMEIQILDDSAPEYAHLKPAQYCGSIYGVVPARRGALKAPGGWNREEILCQGRQVRITLNGQVIVDANLDAVTDPEILWRHPGLQRARGHIGFLGHTNTVAFREVEIQDLSTPEQDPQTPGRDNHPPRGFKSLFNGRDLTGWKGLVADPPHRARMSPAELAAAQSKADEEMRKHWTVADGMIVYDGRNNNLCTARDYGDFEMLVDWKIGPKGDSGIYLRGSPQVQIWDNPEGSGGLYNNQKNPSHPLKNVDNPPGQWNHFHIIMVGEKVTVWLNGQLVTDHVTLENYWERDKPIYPTGQIELQHHGDPLWFKNIYIRELPRTSG